jgi:glycerate 2-kinase
VQGVAPRPRTLEATRAWLIEAAPARVHVLALGKAAPAMALGAVDALREAGREPAGGLIVAAHRPDEPLPLPLRVGDHPLPDIGSLAAADAIASAIAQVEAGDRVLVLVSGGATALCAAPCAELAGAFDHPATAQAAIAEAVQALLARGLAIHEMNALRRRLLRWGAGRLATALYARGAAAIEVLAISDVIGDDASVIGSGPCTADDLDEATLLATCDAHGVRALLHPILARALGLSGGGARPLAPPPATHPAFARTRVRVIAGNRDACQAAAEAACAIGIADVRVSGEWLEGDAESLGARIVRVALRVAAESPEEALLVWGGEPVMHLTPVRIAGDADDPADADDPHATEAPSGGRMQALALAAALELDGAMPASDRLTLLAGSTDGRDGPTDAAGAIVDAATVRLAVRGGRDPARDRHRLRSHRALDAAGALRRTGPSGTNVMDVVLVHVAAAPGPQGRPRTTLD